MKASAQKLTNARIQVPSMNNIKMQKQSISPYNFCHFFLVHRICRNAGRVWGRWQKDAKDEETEEFLSLSLTPSSYLLLGKPVGGMAFSKFVRFFSFAASNLIKITQDTSFKITQECFCHFYIFSNCSTIRIPSGILAYLWGSFWVQTCWHSVTAWERCHLGSAAWWTSSSTSLWL